MTLRVLVVEDDDAVREVVEWALADAGHQTIGALDGQDALRLAMVDHPDVVVLDLELPVMSGTFTGAIDFSPVFAGIPLGSATGTLTVTSSPLAPELTDTTVSFSGVFRNPFAISVQGRPRRGEDAFYLVDGEPVPVKQDERAAGWPTVRFEITFN